MWSSPQDVLNCHSQAGGLQANSHLCILHSAFCLFFRGRREELCLMSISSGSDHHFDIALNQESFQCQGLALLVSK